MSNEILEAVTSEAVSIINEQDAELKRLRVDLERTARERDAARVAAEELRAARDRVLYAAEVEGPLTVEEIQGALAGRLAVWPKG